MSLPHVVSLIFLLPSVFGDNHEDFLNNGWSFIGNVNRFCSAELDQTLYCNTDVIPPCDSSTDGKTVQDRNDHNGCVAQGCESGSQLTRNTYYCGSSRHEAFLSKGWSFVGNVDRFCSAELDQTLYCNNDVIPPCDSSTSGKTVQDRKSHNGCVAQGCESGNQFVQLTYYCRTPSPSNSPTPSPSNSPTHATLTEDRCGRLDIDGYLTGCSTTISTMSTTISTNKDEFDSFKVDVTTALDEIADFNAAHAPIVNIDDDFNKYASISLKDSVMFGLLFLNFVVVIYVFCALKAQNKKLKAGYSRTYNKDIIENASDAQPLKI